MATNWNAPGESGDLDPALTMVEGAEQTRQASIQRLLFFRGEHAQRVDAGVPYIAEIFTRDGAALAGSIVTEALSSIPLVAAVEDVRTEQVGRRINISVTERLVDGTSLDLVADVEPTELAVP